MQVQQLQAKLFVTRADAVSIDGFISVFHRWIQQRSFSEMVLIDVADYRHVPSAPYVMLIAHEGHFAIDGARGGLGLAFGRKHDALGAMDDKISDVVRTLVRGAMLIEGDPEAGQVEFVTNRLQLSVHSRLAVSSTDEGNTFANEAARMLGTWVGGKVTHEIQGRRGPVTIALSWDTPISLVELGARVGVVNKRSLALA